MINIVIPMAGLGSRFSEAGFLKSKPFIDVMGVPMISRVMENLKYQDAHYILIARKEVLDSEKEIVRELYEKYNVTFIEIDSLTEGTACTVLYARKEINNELPLLIANSDQLVDSSIQDFINDCLSKKLDGSILTFLDLDKNPKWSFAKIGSDNLVIKVKEKEAISNLATVGIYFFSKGKYFVDAALDMIVRNDRVNNEFYTCPVYNYMIAEKRKIGVFTISKQEMHGLGTPNDLMFYIKNHN
jgi:NDP-sugar pyrophosphorylase family protein